MLGLQDLSKQRDNQDPEEKFRNGQCRQKFEEFTGNCCEVNIPWALGVESYKRSVTLQEKGCDSSAQRSPSVPEEPTVTGTPERTPRMLRRPYSKTEVSRERTRSICVSSKLPF